MHFNDVLLQHAERLGAIMHKPKRKGHGKGNAEVSHQQRQDGDEETIKQSYEHSGEAPGYTDDTQPNRGTLKVDATVAPQHIGYPTDTRLLAEAR